MNPSNPEQCPFCASPRVVVGKLVADDYGGYFEPEQIRVPGWRKATGIGTCVSTREQARACLACGKLWGDLEAAELQKLLSRFGTDIAKAQCGVAVSS